MAVRKRRLPFAAAVGLIAAFGVPAGAPAQDRAPDLVRRAIADYAAQHRGALAFARHLSFVLRAGPFQHEVRNEIGIAMRDGVYQRVHYYSAATNGRPDDAGELERQEGRANDDLSAGRGFFKRPIDPRFARDYRFAPAACDACLPGAEEFVFTSVVHDRQHGSGTMVIDAATAHVLRLSYSLDRPPEHATSAEVVETFGAALPALWTCLRVEETYHGKLGVIAGTATLTYTLDHFRRFADPGSALAALTDRSI